MRHGQKTHETETTAQGSGQGQIFLTHAGMQIPAGHLADGTLGYVSARYVKTGSAKPGYSIEGGDGPDDRFPTPSTTGITGALPSP